MSGAKGNAQDQGADIDDLIKSATKFLDTWKKAIDDIAKQLDKAGDGKDAKGGGSGSGSSSGGGSGGGSGGKGGQDGGNKKLQDQAMKDAEEAGKKVSEDLKKMLQGQKSQVDPKQGSKATDFFEKYFDKNGVKLKDWGSLKPDVDIDWKKMQVKKVNLEWTWKF